MLDSLKLDNVIFIDIETVSAQNSYKMLSPKWKKLWDHKAKFLVKKEDDNSENLYERAGIYAEFGKIICISIGILRVIDNKRVFRLKSFYGDNEKALLKEFCTLMTKNFDESNYLLCAHNGKEFDFPYLGRRILVNGLKLPYLLDVAGRKPWEVQHLDTLQLWKFGDYKHYTSLDLLTQLFGIKSPKNNISGSDVKRVYWDDKDIVSIKNYCQQDVVAVAQLLLAYKGIKKLNSKEIVFTS